MISLETLPILKFKYIEAGNLYCMIPEESLKTGKVKDTPIKHYYLETGVFTPDSPIQVITLMLKLYRIINSNPGNCHNSVDDGLIYNVSEGASVVLTLGKILEQNHGDHVLFRIIPEYGSCGAAPEIVTIASRPR